MRNICTMKFPSFLKDNFGFKTYVIFLKLCFIVTLLANLELIKFIYSYEQYISPRLSQYGTYYFRPKIKQICFLIVPSTYTKYFLHIKSGQAVYDTNYFFDFSSSFHNSYKNTFLRLRLGGILCLIGANRWYQFRLDTCGGRFYMLIQLGPLDQIWSFFDIF